MNDAPSCDFDCASALARHVLQRSSPTNRSHTMRKTDSTKKLVLGSETLVPLQPEQLETAVGGISIISRSCCQRNSCNTKQAA